MFYVGTQHNDYCLVPRGQTIFTSLSLDFITSYYFLAVPFMQIDGLIRVFDRMRNNYHHHINVCYLVVAVVYLYIDINIARTLLAYWSYSFIIQVDFVSIDEEKDREGETLDASTTLILCLMNKHDTLSEAHTQRAYVTVLQYGWVHAIMWIPERTSYREVTSGELSYTFENMLVYRITTTSRRNINKIEIWYFRVFRRCFTIEISLYVLWWARCVHPNESHTYRMPVCVLFILLVELFLNFTRQCRSSQ